MCLISCDLFSLHPDYNNEIIHFVNEYSHLAQHVYGEVIFPLNLLFPLRLLLVLLCRNLLNKFLKFFEMKT